MSSNRLVLEGRSGSPGVGIGRLLWIPTTPHFRPVAPLTNGSSRVASETARLEAALDATARDLDVLAADLTARAGEEVGTIFEAQALFARDPGIVGPAIVLIEAGSSAAEAIEQSAAEQADSLAGVDDAYFRERATDIRDVARRVVDRLEGRVRPELHHRDGTLAIVAGEDLEPSTVASLRLELVAGIALANGATTGHAAIVARAIGIPLVLGLGPALDVSLDGRAAGLDGMTARLIVDPSADDLARLEAESRVPAAPTDLSARSADVRSADHGGSEAGPVTVEANVGSVREAEQAAAAGADGIGLVRTELLFLGRALPPGLGEQRSVYRGIAAAMAGRRVVFRTLDIGGDKPEAYAGTEREENPALGVRGIRLGLRRPELLETQLRALLEATPDEPLHVLLPMVATIDEVVEARLALDRAAAAATADGARVATDVRLGVMIEVPAAALMADVIAPAVDFFSIGTNDLVQYTLAADRTNPMLADLASPLQPAILRLVAAVARAATAAGRPVTVCGEAAADPLAGPIFVGLGVTELSVAPRSIGAVRARLAALGMPACRMAADAALGASTVAEVHAAAEPHLGTRDGIPSSA